MGWKSKLFFKKIKKFKSLKINKLMNVIINLYKFNENNHIFKLYIF